MHARLSATHPLSGSTRLLAWIAQLAAAVILGQTLFFKFSGAPEAVALFEKLGAEPWGRIGTGLLELVAVLLLLTPRFAAYGGVLAAGLMVGAIAAHLTRLGIEVAGDKGTLFGLAWAVLVCGITVAVLRRADLPLPTRPGVRSEK